jgi:hypothetical protein
MKARYVAPVRTPVQAVEYAQGLELELGGDGAVPAGLIAVLMAHAALECGRDPIRNLIGPSCWRYNFGNVKASESWAGLFTCITLNEYLTEGGKRTLIWFAPEGRLAGGPGTAIVGPSSPVPDGHPQTRMRAHDTLAEGIAAKIAFLSQPRFGAAMSYARAGNPDGYVRAIHAQRYFTADLEPYARAVSSLTKTYALIAQKIASEPLPLAEHEEAHVDSVIEAHAAAPSMLSPDDIPWLDVTQTWQDTVLRERDAAVREPE